jgi:hypothetical protein
VLSSVDTMLVSLSRFLQARSWLKVIVKAYLSKPRNTHTDAPTSVSRASELSQTLCRPRAKLSGLELDLET